MKTKTMIALLLLMALAIFVVPVNAAPLGNQWFIDHAILEVESSYSITDTDWTGAVVTGWHSTPVKWHKHVTLDGQYGYMNTGTLHWEGRVYDDGTTYTMTYTKTNPEPKPQYHYKTTWKNPQHRKIWTGTYWIDNPDTYSYWENGRFWVVFPKP